MSNCTFSPVTRIGYLGDLPDSGRWAGREPLPRVGHIHLAPVGTNGPVASILFLLSNDPGIFGGNVILNRTESLNKDLDGNSWLSIIEAIESGVAYVNIHTDFYLAGEIRGNFVPELGTATLLALGMIGLAKLGGRGAPTATG